MHAFDDFLLLFLGVDDVLYLVVPVILAIVTLWVIWKWYRRRRRQPSARATGAALFGTNDVDGSHPSGADGGVEVPASKHRFRKRDKVLFYGKKMLRKVKNLAGVGVSSPNGGPSSSRGPKLRKRERVLRLIGQKLLRLPKEPTVRTVIKRPPSAFFEPDSGAETVDPNIPPDVYLLLKNIRVFGHFETPFFFELCKKINKPRSYPVGEYLFQPGDPDDKIYIVQRGLIGVSIRQENGVEMEVKRVHTGESVFSLLSILDVLTMHTGYMKTVSAKAIEPSVILILCADAFNEIFERYPESWVRAIQIIMIRLQRVTMTTLHNYLGLSTELMKQTLRELPQRRPTQSQLATGPGEGSEAPRPRRGSSATFSSSASVPMFTPPQAMAGGESAHFPTSTPIVGDRQQPVAIASRFQRTDPNRRSLQHRGDSTSSTDARTSTDTPVDVAGADPTVTCDMRQRHGSVDRRESTRCTINYRVHLAELFGLDTYTLLEDKIQVLTHPPGYTLTQQGSPDVVIVYVITGCLEVMQKIVGDEEQRQELVCYVHPRDIVGGLAVLTGEVSFYTVRTRMFSRVAVLKKEDFYCLMRDSPKVVVNVAHSVVRRLSPFIRSIDFALDWEMVEAGKALYQQDDEADSLHVVLSGRLRSVVKDATGKRHLVEEYGRGDLVGLVEVLTERPTTTSVIAIRYSELAKLPKGLLSLIKLRYPQVLTRMIRLLGQCIHQKLTPSVPLTAGVEPLANVTNLNTIAVMAVSQDVPLTAFTLEFCHALNAFKTALRLSADIILSKIGATALDSVNEYHLFNYLSQQEDANSVVVYQCDFELTNWTKRCVRQADCILIVANGASEPTVGPVEQQLEQLAVRAQKELVLLWKENVTKPYRTADWLDVRGWVSSHYHVRCPNRMFIRRSNHRLVEMYERISTQSMADKFSDFSRLARTLTGNAIGLVLGGGGARGAAHIGVVKAMKEFGVPIDIVGGVSIGSFIGAIYCETPDVLSITQRARAWFLDMTSFWSKLTDLTWPAAAIFTGRGFNGTLKAVFRDVQIEDLWLPYFNITTDITSSEMRVHRNGEVWLFCRASMSYPGIVPPLCDPLDGHYLVDGCYINNLPGSAWRYVRASMSLAGYLPPLCDPADEHLLLDGGYVNNLPADVMRSSGIRNVIAVDVGGQDEQNLTNYGDHLSGLWVLYHRYWPWAKPIRVLSMAEIQSRLAYVSCIRQLEIVKKAEYCHYIRPPIDRYQTMSFAQFEEIYEVGYNHAKALLDVWQKSDKLAAILRAQAVAPATSGEQLAGASVAAERRKHSEQTMSSFTDLAALVSRIQRPQAAALSDVSDAEMDESDDDEEEEEDDEALSGAESDGIQPSASETALVTLSDSAALIASARHAPEE